MHSIIIAPDQSGVSLFQCLTKRVVAWSLNERRRRVYAFSRHYLLSNFWAISTLELSPAQISMVNNSAEALSNSILYSLSLFISRFLFLILLSFHFYRFPFLPALAPLISPRASTLTYLKCYARHGLTHSLVLNLKELL